MVLEEEKQRKQAQKDAEEERKKRHIKGRINGIGLVVPFFLIMPTQNNTGEGTPDDIDIGPSGRVSEREGAAGDAGQVRDTEEGRRLGEEG